MKRNSPKGILFLISAAVVWGGAFVVQCLVSERITPLFFNAARFFVGAISLIPVIFIFEKNATDKKMLKNTVKVGVLAGIILCTASYLQQLGIGLTDSAGKSGFITGLYMVFVPFIGIFFGRKTALKSWIGAILGVAGLFFICMSESKLTFTVGDLVLIVGAFMYAAHIVVIDRHGNAIYSIRFSAVQFLTSAIISFIGALIFEPVGIEPLLNSVIPILYCGILSVGVGYTFQTLGQKFSEPTSAAILLSTEAVFSALFGAIFLNERMEPISYIGCALIFAGIIIAQINLRPIKRKYHFKRKQQ